MPWYEKGDEGGGDQKMGRYKFIFGFGEAVSGEMRGRRGQCHGDIGTELRLRPYRLAPNSVSSASIFTPYTMCANTNDHMLIGRLTEGSG